MEKVDGRQKEDSRSLEQQRLPEGHFLVPREQGGLKACFDFLEEEHTHTHTDQFFPWLPITGHAASHHHHVGTQGGGRKTSIQGGLMQANSCSWEAPPADLPLWDEETLLRGETAPGERLAMAGTSSLASRNQVWLIQIWKDLESAALSCAGTARPHRGL